MRSVKVVVTGPVRAGTTSLIRSVSEIAVLSTERRVANRENARGESVVAMDFGRITISDDLVLYLFGTPGDELDSLVGGPFTDGMIGIVVTVDVTRPTSVDQGREIIEFLERHSDAPYVVAANHMHAQGPDAMTSLRSALDVPDDVPVVACDAVIRASVKPVLVALLRRILETMP
jgi:signal recognition particle receptor subunit beta